MTLAGPQLTSATPRAERVGGDSAALGAVADAPAVDAVRAADASALTWAERVSDRLFSARDGLYASATFQRWAARIPGVRRIARRRSRAVFDLVAGFAYTQTVAACVQCGLLTLIADGPVREDALLARLELPVDGARRLLAAAAALQLVERRAGGRWGLGVTGGPLLASPGLAQLVEHNALLYEDLRDPLALLRRESNADDALAYGALAAYWPYTDAPRRARLGAADVSGYSALMSATVAPVADELLDAVPLARCRTLLDVGGGEGTFLIAAARRHAHLMCTLFDLAPVAARGRRRVAEAGLDARVQVVGGDFVRDALPAGADVATLVRVCLDHDDATVHALLCRVREALAPGGMVVIAEPLAGVRGAEAVGDVYFAYYLRAMGRGRARRVEEFRALLEGAGFRRVRVRPTRYPVVAGVITGEV